VENLKNISHGQDSNLGLFFVVKGPAADAMNTPQPSGLLCNRVIKIISFYLFPCNGAPVE
jgi:hypothetical protein